MNHTPNINGIPSIFVIFGMTGDLAAKKIIPSLWHLFLHDRLPKKISIIGFSRRNLSGEELNSLVVEAVKKHTDHKTNENDIVEFLKFFSYKAGVFEDEEAFKSLHSQIYEVEKNWGVCTNKLFYLAVPPSSYEPIFENLAKVKLNIPCGGDLGWSRILIEKPFGTDLISAQKLQTLLSKYFKEEQIYRIDHYLFKEIIQGIENFRFSNNLFENAWDNTMIERIDIRILESIGVEDRGGFYDTVGAIRDVGQNHILSMLVAITTEYNSLMDVDEVRKNRVFILDSLAKWTDEALKENTYRSQYDGYKNIKGVNTDSETETYFALKTELDHPRWKGIPIYMEAGKSIAESRKEIILTLKHPSNCLLCEQGSHSSNRIVFRLEPNDEVVIHFLTKKPGFDREVEERDFSFFLYEKESKVEYVEEYAKTINSAMGGDQTLFVSPEEVESSWKFIDPIVDSWKRGLVPLLQYEPKTTPVFFDFRTTKKNCKDYNSEKKELGIIGLGKMGGNIARRLLSKKWNVVGYNKSEKETKDLESQGLKGTYSLQEFVDKLSTPRTIWTMVPHEAMNVVLEELTPFLLPGDVIIDGGNSEYKESMRRGKELNLKGVGFIDAGVSGGPGGALAGACIMVGGEKDLYDRYENLFRDLSVKDGYGYMGKSGAGHFVKMIHNGIEYGMMQAIGEGFEVMKKSSFSLNLRSVAEIYSHGSVISSSLINWLVEAYSKFGDDLNNDEYNSGQVSHSGEGQWTVDTAKELGVPVPIIEGSLEFRKKSKDNPSYTGRVLSALRHQFGGHSTNINKNKEK